MFLSLGMVLLIYAAVSISALSAVGAEALSLSDRPLAFTISEAGFGRWSWFVTLGASMATLGVMLSLMAGIDRTLFAMAADHRMPSYMAKVHPVHKVPHLAGVTVGVILIIIVLTVDVRSAIGFSAFTVLLYYAITNLSAITLSRSERMLGRWSAFAGLLGCLVLSFTLPPGAVIAGGLVMLVGLALYLAQWRRARSA
jgi:APA family basic amino acid/polyamine antiporter